MKQVQTTLHRGRFQPLAATRRAQVAKMELRPGESSDEEVSNEHPRSEQWLYVVRGTGSATVIPRHGRRRRIPLKAGSLLVIEAGERHQIRNTGRKLLSTVNFYVPPAYSKGGNVLPQTSRSR
ncbi:MAG TPA: cupin domain-containing protein [Pirellulaceae bacterium]|nr:cupin domain-containing protein [Pirellulaceae bacterium]